MIFTYANKWQWREGRRVANGDKDRGRHMGEDGEYGGEHGGACGRSG